MRAERFDFLAIGTGLAGLTFALEAAEHGRVCILTKADAADANTSYAQGGIAAAMGEADSWELHEQDTLVAGAGLCDPEAVRFLVQKAPEAIQWLLNVGARFDTAPSGGLSLGLEGGHSQKRIVHFQDRTGWEVERAVIDAVRRHPNIQVIEHAFVTQLLIDGGRCFGAAAMLEGLGLTPFYAKSTLLATGGCGVMYQHTTNPRVATGDGIALADAAGARISGMEFMQFHPTTLYHPQLRGYLITEACRGAGGTLRNHFGRRFMYDYDDRLELAPRDIVARAIDAEMKRLQTWCVYLDMAHLPRGAVQEEFPTIYEKLNSIGLEFDREWAPIVPAQHYSCGGVATDLNGKTTLAGLYAAGEVASTGVHGANRLASNSLLEALVFAREAAHSALSEPGSTAEPEPKPPKCVTETESVLLRRALQHAMTEKVGIVRTHLGLSEAEDEVERLLQEFDTHASAPYSPHPLETRNLLVAARHVVQGARRRSQNVGLHFNSDLVQQLS